MKNSKTIKKTTTYTATMYQKARLAADYLGLTFHEYLKHLIAQDIRNLNIPSYKLDDEAARDVLKSYREYEEGQLKDAKGFLMMLEKYVLKRLDEENR